MKKFLIGISLLMALPCEAQTTRSNMLGYNASTFTNCGTNCITGPMLQNWNSTLVNSAGFLRDNNSWTGRNIFNNSLQGAINLVPSAPPSTPADGDLWVTATEIYAQIGGVSYNLLAPSIVAPYVSTNAALTTAASTAFPNGVWRDSYSGTAYAPPLWYTPSASACSLNAGAGDGGSQVPTSDGKCWIASFPSNNIDAREFGASNAAASDATAAIQSTINYVESLSTSGTNTGANVYLPAGEYLVFSTLTINQNYVGIIGDGKSKTLIARSSAYGDTFLVNNSGQIQGITFRGLTMWHNVGPGNAMTGAHIDLVGCLHCLVDDVNTQNGAVGIEIQGGVYITVKNSHMQGAYASGVAAYNGLAGFWVVAAPSTNVTNGAVLLPAIVNVEHSQINGSGALSGTTVVAGWQYAHLINAVEEIHFTDCTFNGGYYAQGYIQQTSSNYNILEVTYASSFFDGGSTVNNTGPVYTGPWFGLWISGAAGNGSAVISRVSIVNTSFNGEGVNPNGSSFGNGIYVDGTNRGGFFQQALGSLEVTGSRVQGYYGNGVDLEGGNSILFTGNNIFSNNGAAAAATNGIYINSSVSKFNIVGNIIGGIYGTTDSQKYAITIVNGATGSVADNNLCNNATGGIYDATAAPTTSPRNVFTFNNTCFNGARASVAGTMPATGVNQYNPTGSPAMMSIAGGTITAVYLNGTQIASGATTIFVGAQDFVKFTYTGSPTLTWWPQ